MPTLQAQAGDVSMWLSCYRCSWWAKLSNRYFCPVCGSSLMVDYPSSVLRYNGWPTRELGIWRYRRVLPILRGTEPVTLGEGDTPLLRASRLEGSGELFLKNETVNPTASFKDRPVAVATTVAQGFGLEGVICASTGNTAVAVAAYAAQAGLPAVCLVPQDTPAAKLTQVEAAGARVVRVRGDYSHAHFLATEVTKRYGWADLTSTYVNPYMLEGDKTITYELHEQLDGRVPDRVVVPVGAGPLLAAIYKGFEELKRAGLIQGDKPKMVAVQAAGCSPIVRAFEQGAEEVRAWEEPVDTKASSIADPLRGYPDDGTRTLSAVRRSGGEAIAVSEEETYNGMAELARTEGLFVEPGAAVAVAAYRKLLSRELVYQGERTVLVLTGHGLKDPEALQRTTEDKTREVPSVGPQDIEALGEVLERTEGE